MGKEDTVSCPPGTGTVLEALLASIEKAAVHNRSVTVAPAAVLWPDEGRQWEPLLPVLRKVCPHLLTLGSYDPAKMTGPAIWLRCLLGRQLEAAGWPPEAVPVVYLPGVGRHMLRAVESCPKHLQPLAELQYRGVFWSQVNARDWTVLAFLKSPDGGLGLDVAQDHATLEAIGRSLVPLADTPVESLRGRRLEAPDFDHLLTADPVRDLLRWLNDPAGTCQVWGEAVWGAFRSVCKADFGFDPHSEGELVGAERLGAREGEWGVVWERFAEAPRLYPGVPGLLRKAQPKSMDLFADRAPWPAENELAEAELKKTLLAPLALALEHLAVVADAAEKAIGGATPQEREPSTRRAAGGPMPRPFKPLRVWRATTTSKP